MLAGVIPCAVVPAALLLAALMAGCGSPAPANVPLAFGTSVGGQLVALAALKAVGELVTCPFCTAMWISTAMTAGPLTATMAFTSFGGPVQVSPPPASQTADITSGFLQSAEA